MDPTGNYHTSDLTIIGPEISEFTWDFEIPPRSKILKNIESVCFGGFQFAGLQFKTGFLADVEHRWGLIFYSNQIHATMSLPSRDQHHRYSVKDSSLEFISNDQVKSTHILKFGPEENYMIPIRMTWTSIWTNKDFSWNDGVNKIRINFRVFRETCCFVSNTGLMSLNANQPLKVKALDASEFFMDLHLSDLILECEGQRFPCHRVHLASRCPIFYDMVCNSDEMVCEGNEMSRVYITDIKPDILQQLLRFIYCDVDKMNLARLSTLMQMELLKMAAMYGLKALQILCEEEVAMKVTKENCMEMLERAKECNARLLKEKAVYMIKANKQIILKDREAFKEFIRNHVDIAYELLTPAQKSYRPI